MQTNPRPSRPTRPSLCSPPRRPRRTTATALVVGALLLLPLAFVTGCETPVGPVRVTTMPPDLGYLPPEQIRTAMWVLAAEIGELERALERQNARDPIAYQADIRARLARMRTAAETLDRPGRSSQHPVLNQNLDRFTARIRRAERSAERTPPDYFPASTLAGTCYLCHGQTVGAAPSAMRNPGAS